MKKVVVIAKVLALAMTALLISYISTNLNITITGEKTVLKYWEAFIDWAGLRNDKSQKDDIVCINVAFDKQLIDVTDEFGFPKGRIAITDREKLVDLLQLLQSTPSYRYILLDVFFEEGYDTSVDSSLFSIIGSLDRIVIPNHMNGRLSEFVPIEKTAYADYNISINENDFTKFQLLYDGGPSLPLRMYTDDTGMSIEKKGFLYTEKGSISRKVIFPKMYLRTSLPYGENGKKEVLNLGCDILDYTNEINWAELFADKFIIIGAFSDDIHATYAGDLPGCLINYNIFLSLKSGNHRIPWGLTLLYLIIFSIMATLLLSGKNVVGGTWGWVLTKLFLLYSVVLTIVCILVFEAFGQAQDIFITSSFFSIIDLVKRRYAPK